MAPSNEYLLLLAQPAIRIPITETDETALTYNTPILISHIWNPLANGIGARMSMAMMITTNGARLNKNLSAPSGVSPSFTTSFNVSARVCSVPPGPTRFGPKRICIYAETFLSMNTRTNPSIANKPITHTPTIANSTNNASVELNVLFNH